MLTPEWNKSTKSNPSGNCVEVRFAKSSYSQFDGNCVEVAMQDDRIQVRDSKDTQGPVLSFTRGEWVAFLDGAKDSEFDIEEV